MKYTCDECKYKTDDIEDLEEIQDLQERVSVGEIYPAGECPECGALVGAADADVASGTTLWHVANLMRGMGWTVEKPE